MPKYPRTRQRARRIPSPSPISSESDSGGNVRSRSGSGSFQNAGSVWTAADDEVLASARAAGLNWQPIAARHFPTKTANACRKRHERLMERRYQDDWGQERLEDLAVAYFECRPEIWSVLGDKFDIRWTMAEAKIMEKGLKNLQNIARASYKRRMRVLEQEGLQFPHPLGDRSDEYRSTSLSDADSVLSRLSGPSSTVDPGLKKPKSPAPSPKRAPRQLLQLPLYVPPMCATVVKPTTTATAADWSGDGQYRRWSDPRDICSIKALLSSAD
ncbi:hypothetical protein ANO11243_013820 [Dothideomycetidae sp. 11243]|nr:hypothetical protein ANO11243_013820 [fungal sp. No.11243]